MKIIWGLFLGCRLVDLFKLLNTSASKWLSVLDESNRSSTNKIYNFLSNLVGNEEELPAENNYASNFLIKLLINQDDIDFYVCDTKTVSNNTGKAAAAKARAAAIINDGENRGFCKNYLVRKLVNQTIKSNPIKPYNHYLKELVHFN